MGWCSARRVVVRYLLPLPSTIWILTSNEVPSITLAIAVAGIDYA